MNDSVDPEDVGVPMIAPVDSFGVPMPVFGSPGDTGDFGAIPEDSMPFNGHPMPVMGGFFGEFPDGGHFDGDEEGQVVPPNMVEIMLFGTMGSRPSHPSPPQVPTEDMVRPVAE